MVDCPLAPLHDKIKAAIAAVSSAPIRHLINTHFHGEQTGGNERFHQDGVAIVARDNVRIRLAADTTNGLNGNKNPAAPAGALPTVSAAAGRLRSEAAPRSSPMSPTRIRTATPSSTAAVIP